MHILLSLDHPRLKRSEHIGAAGLSIVADQDIALRHALCRHFMVAKIAVYCQFLVTEHTLICDHVVTV